MVKRVDGAPRGARPGRPARERGGEPGEERAQPALELRKRFASFTAEDAALLHELAPAFERDAERIVDRFYEHLDRFEPLRPLLGDPAVRARLRDAQAGYLRGLTSGRYGKRYFAGRLAIGRVHERIGLEPQWYLGTYGLYADLLLPIVEQHHPDDRGRAMRAAGALVKLMVLDMQVALDAYYETRQRKAVEKSEQLAAVGTLAASIAHEVRNPLAGMKGALQVLRDEFDRESPNLEIIDEVLAQIVRLEGLVRDLLTFARPRALVRQPVELHELLDRILRLFQDEIDAARIAVERRYDARIGVLDVDLEQMEQVLLNLIQNAIQAMEGGGALVVETRADPTSVALELRDTGRGILPADMPRIFQPFFTTKHRGSGLGLSIVKKIVEAHGGTIDVESALGRGTTVRLALDRGAS